MRTRRIDMQALRHTRLFGMETKHTLRCRRATDVAHAHKKDADFRFTIHGILIFLISLP
jgi:hypothetical protein